MCIILIEIIENAIEVSVLLEKELSESFFHIFQSLWLNTKSQKRGLMMKYVSCSKDTCFFYIWHNYSTVIWKPPHNGKVRDVISLSKLGFHTQYCVNISVLPGEKRDYASVFISIITVNITIPGSRHCACFICHDDLPYSHTGMLERLFRSREAGGMWMRVASVWRESRDID